MKSRLAFVVPARLWPAAATLAVVALAAAVGIGLWRNRETTEAAPAAAAPAPGVSARSVRYTFAWDLTGVQVKPTGGFVIRTDRGARIELERLRVVDYTAALVPCTPQAHTTAAAGWLERVGGWLIPTARAGHDGSVDPSTVQAPAVDDASRQEPLQYGARALGDTRYCRVHVSIARAPLDGPLRPVDATMAGRSVDAAGSWLDTSDVVHSFTASGTMANGGFRDLVVEAPQGPDELVVEVIRPLAQMFDGVDFTTDNEAAIARRIVGNAIAHMRVVTRRGAPTEQRP